MRAAKAIVDFAIAILWCVLIAMYRVRGVESAATFCLFMALAFTAMFVNDALKIGREKKL